jgi:hypothetical protein
MNGNRAMTAALAMQPMVIKGIKATLVLLFNCKCHTRKPGIIAKVKSVMMLNTL